MKAEIIELTLAAIVPILGWLTLHAARWIAMLRWNAFASGVAVRTVYAAERAVRYVLSTYTDQIKAAREDGKLTDEERLQARRQAMIAARSYLGDRGLTELGRILGVSDGPSSPTVDAHLDTEIEATLHRIRDRPPPA